jgi:DNA invertase Pin-like site-specific DNA recombinase
MNCVMKHQRNTTTKLVAIYVRVSTADQSCDLQKRELLAHIKSQQQTVFRIYEDKRTGTNNKRPQLQELLQDARDKKFSIIICWKLDRLFRSLKDLITTLQEFSDLGVAFVSLKDNIDLSTNTGRLMMHLLGAFAEFEASIIRERVKAGILNAQANGKRIGREKRVNSELIIELSTKGYTQRKIAKLAKCSPTTVCRELKLHKPPL